MAVQIPLQARVTDDTSECGRWNWKTLQSNRPNGLKLIGTKGQNDLFDVVISVQDSCNRPNARVAFLLRYRIASTVF